MLRPRRGCSLACSHGLLSLVLLTGVLSWLSYRTQDHLPRDGTAYKSLGPPPSITN